MLSKFIEIVWPVLEILFSFLFFSFFFAQRFLGCFQVFGGLGRFCQGFAGLIRHGGRGSGEDVRDSLRDAVDVADLGIFFLGPMISKHQRFFRWWRSFCFRHHSAENFEYRFVKDAWDSLQGWKRRFRGFHESIRKCIDSRTAPRLDPVSTSFRGFYRVLKVSNEF